MLVQKFKEYDVKIEPPVIFQEILRRFVKKLGEENKAAAYDWDLLIQEYLSEFNIPWACQIEEFFCSEDLVKYTYLYKDTDILEYLLEQGYALNILTNGLPKYQYHVIGRLELDQYFNKVIMPNPETIKVVKPYLDIFRLAMDEQPTPHYMVGDSLYFDIFGGNKAGCKTIWIHRKLPKKYQELSIEARTNEINSDEKFLLKYILRGAPFLKLAANQNELLDFKPDYIISTLRELKELF